MQIGNAATRLRIWFEPAWVGRRSCSADHFIIWEHLNNLRTVLFNWLFMPCRLQRPLSRIWWTFDSFGPKMKLCDWMKLFIGGVACVALFQWGAISSATGPLLLHLKVRAVGPKFELGLSQVVGLKWSSDFEPKPFTSAHHFFHQWRLNQLKFK